MTKRGRDTLAGFLGPLRGRDEEMGRKDNRRERKEKEEREREREKGTEESERRGSCSITFWGSCYLVCVH